MAVTEHKKNRRDNKPREKGLRWTLADAGIELPEALQRVPRKRHKNYEGKERPSPHGMSRAQQQPAGVSRVMSDPNVQAHQHSHSDMSVPPAGGNAALENRLAETMNKSFGGLLTTLEKTSIEMSKNIEAAASGIVNKLEEREKALREEEKKERFKARLLDMGQNTVEQAFGLGVLYAAALIVRSVWRGRNAHLETPVG